jgi:DNA-binding transcriptional regulator YhcF (GntR family)
MLEKTKRELAAESLLRFVDEMRALGCKDDDILSELGEYLKEGGKNDANA